MFPSLCPVVNFGVLKEIGFLIQPEPAIILLLVFVENQVLISLHIKAIKRNML